VGGEEVSALPANCHFDGINSRRAFNYINKCSSACKLSFESTSIGGALIIKYI